MSLPNWGKWEKWSLSSDWLVSYYKLPNGVWLSRFRRGEEIELILVTTLKWTLNDGGDNDKIAEFAARDGVDPLTMKCVELELVEKFGGPEYVRSEDGSIRRAGDEASGAEAVAVDGRTVS